MIQKVIKKIKNGYQIIKKFINNNIILYMMCKIFFNNSKFLKNLFFNILIFNQNYLIFLKKMNLLCGIAFIFLILNKVNTDSTTAKAIKNLILNSNYDSAYQPLDFMQIYLDMFFKQVVKLDQTNQIIVSSSTLVAQWYDQRLAWNITEYPMGVLTLKATQIWLPDLFVINSADLNGFVPVSSSNLATVYYSGLVLMYYSLNSINKSFYI